MSSDSQESMLETQSLTIRPKSLARGFLHFTQTPRYWTFYARRAPKGAPQTVLSHLYGARPEPEEERKNYDF